MICQADAVVTIGIPSSAMLQAQSEQVAVGHEMPVYPLFAEVKKNIKKSNFHYLPFGWLTVDSFGMSRLIFSLFMNYAKISNGK